MAQGGELGDDFVDLVRELIVARVDFIIVGAHALAVHGIPRATGDLDVLVAPTRENGRRVFTALVAFGAPVLAHHITPEDFASPRFVYQIGLPPNRIDLLTSIDGVSFEETRSTRVWAKMDGLAIPFLGRSALLKNKRAAGRPKDLVDIALLETATRSSKPRRRKT